MFRNNIIEVCYFCNKGYSTLNNVGCPHCAKETPNPDVLIYKIQLPLDDAKKKKDFQSIIEELKLYDHDKVVETMPELWGENKELDLVFRWIGQDCVTDNEVEELCKPLGLRPAHPLRLALFNVLSSDFMNRSQAATGTHWQHGGTGCHLVVYRNPCRKVGGFPLFSLSKAQEMNWGRMWFAFEPGESPYQFLPEPDDLPYPANVPLCPDCGGTMASGVLGDLCEVCDYSAFNALLLFSKS